MKTPILSAILLSHSLATATEITFYSQGSAVDPKEWNSAGAPTKAVTPHQRWNPAFQGSTWVSYENTGYQGGEGYVVIPNGTVVSFFEELFLPWIPSAAWIFIMADDSVTLRLNGVAVVEEALQAGNWYWVCSDSTVGCRAETALRIEISPYLTMGVNELRFDVAQRGWYSFGLNYAGVVVGLVADDPIEETPEPGTWFLGAPLWISWGWMRRLKSERNARL